MITTLAKMSDKCATSLEVVIMITTLVKMLDKCATTILFR
jgi:hypothetical protein